MLKGWWCEEGGIASEISTCQKIGMTKKTKKKIVLSETELSRMFPVGTPRSSRCIWHASGLTELTIAREKIKCSIWGSANGVNRKRRVATELVGKMKWNKRQGAKAWTKYEQYEKVSINIAKIVWGPSYTKRKGKESNKLSHALSHQFFSRFAFVPRINNSFNDYSRSEILWIEPQLHQLSSHLGQSLTCSDVISKSLGKTIE